jgi:hypothetical protein
VNVILADADHAPTAIEATTEAVRIYAELANAEPAVFASLRDAAEKTLAQLTAD